MPQDSEVHRTELLKRKGEAKQNRTVDFRLTSLTPNALPLDQTGSQEYGSVFLLLMLLYGHRHHKYYLGWGALDGHFAFTQLLSSVGEHLSSKRGV